MEAGDKAPRYSPSSSLPSCSMQSALAYPASGSAGESLTQVGRSRAVVVSLIAMMSSSRRLRALLDTTSHGWRLVHELGYQFRRKAVRLV